MLTFVALVTWILLLSTYCRAFQERADFCIETEPLLLTDIGRHVVIDSDKDTNCHITATTLTLKEKVGSNRNCSSLLSSFLAFVFFSGVSNTTTITFRSENIHIQSNVNQLKIHLQHI